MDAARWNRAQEIFHRAAELAAAHRAAFVEAECGDDIALRDEVIALLEEDGRHTSVLGHGPAELARDLLGSGGSTTRMVGPYRVLSLIGRGGMGVVYLGEHDELGRHAAIKLLPDAWISATRRERFAEEQRALSRLTHPYIASLYDAGVLEDGTPWFAMEFVDGKPLAESCGGAEAATRLRLFKQVCEAVQYAHGQAILHRDLKPSNILVDGSGNARLLDFGIAKRLTEEQPADGHTRTGLAMMTPAYAAPEQLRGEPATVRSDVYSLGAILWELLAGEPLFDVAGKAPADALATILSGATRAPSSGADRARGPSKANWADLDVIALKALHQEPGRRYGSAEAILRDIDRYLRNEPLEARPDEAWYRMRKFAARHRTPLAAAALAVVALTATVTFFTLRLASARDDALAESARAQRIQQFMLNLFQGGEHNEVPAEDLRVLTLLDRGARDARALSADPAAQADLMNALGEIYSHVGRHDKSAELLEAALALRRTQEPRNPALVAESTQALAVLRQEQGKQEEAEGLAREALELARRELPEQHLRIAAALGTLGQVLTGRGKYPEAIDALEQAQALQPETASGQERGNLLMSLADAQFYAGRYDQTERLSREALDIYRRVYGEGHPRLADPMYNLGEVAIQRGRVAEAESWFRRTLGIHQNYYGEEHPETAASMRALAQAILMQKRFDEAQPLLERSLEIRRKIFGPVHPAVAITMNALGHVATGKHDYATAERMFRGAADAYRAIHGDGHHFVAIALANLSVVYIDRGEYARAEALLRDVLRRYAKVLPADHLEIAIGRVKLGRALVGAGKLEEAERELRMALPVLERTPDSPWVKQARETLEKAAARTVRRPGAGSGSPVP
ncbi:MAG: serine/threonine-protein kinase [Bryobacteraceae bacterium]